MTTREAGALFARVVRSPAWKFLRSTLRNPHKRRKTLFSSGRRVTAFVPELLTRSDYSWPATTHGRRRGASRALRMQSEASSQQSFPGEPLSPHGWPADRPPTILIRPKPPDRRCQGFKNQQFSTYHDRRTEHSDGTVGLPRIAARRTERPSAPSPDDPGPPQAAGESDGERSRTPSRARGRGDRCAGACGCRDAFFARSGC